MPAMRTDETKTIDIRAIGKARPVSAKPAHYARAVQPAPTGSHRRIALIAIVVIAIWLLWKWF
jgi:hypothetical protein